MSMRIGAKIKGVERLRKRMQSVTKNYEKAAVEAVAEATLLVHGEAVKLLQDNTDGTPQVRYSPKRTVMASNPGDPPNTDRGTAVKSIKYGFLNKGLTGMIGTNLRYLAGFETTTGPHQRPWLSVALKNTAKDIARIFQAKLKGVKP